MTREEEITFCKKRIREQNIYIGDTINKSLTFKRRLELIHSALGVRKRFANRLIHLYGLAYYIYFKCHEKVWY